MKVVPVLVGISLLLLCAVFFSQNFFSAHKLTLLYNPYISEITEERVESNLPDTVELPVDCVLSYGTYTINQKECDELSLIDASPNPNDEMISCKLKDGTFSFTKKECEVLSKATESRDVLKTLD